MGGHTRGNSRRRSVDTESHIRATRDAIAKRAQNVLQYEWAPYLEAKPPHDDHDWEYLDRGKPWGRIKPNAWTRDEVTGFDLHFEHFPTARALQRGQLRFELHLEDGVSGDADFSAATPYAKLREQLLARFKHLQQCGQESTHETSERGTGRILWQKTYSFTAGDPIAYYETLRTALTEHSEYVAPGATALASVE